MNKRLSTGFACIVAAALTASVQAQDSDREAKLAELQETIERVQKQLATAQGERDSLTGELQSSESHIADLMSKIDKLKADLEQQKKN